MSKALEFMRSLAMSPERVDPIECARDMLKTMELGLASEQDTVPMIPTYLRSEGSVPRNEPVIVIDAGGTNFRTALVTFTDGGYTVEGLAKAIMPGVTEEVDWDSFIRFVADALMPIIDRADDIGFCFSYPAHATEDLDGRVIRFTKQVKISGAVGRPVCGDLRAELARRGITGKNIVILNDTPAVLLGGYAMLNAGDYGGFIGQVSGTGANTCCMLPVNRIGKLGRSESYSILVNLESGSYSGLPFGVVDAEMDSASVDPGSQRLEKMTAGVYLGDLTRRLLVHAADDGLLCPATAENVYRLGSMDASVVDAWASGEGLDKLCGTEADAAFVREISLAMFERSARCMCANLIAILLLTGEGSDPTHPVCVCAEGSLVQKGRHFRPMLEGFLKSFAGDKLGRYTVVTTGSDTTLLGSAAAALLNR